MGVPSTLVPSQVTVRLYTPAVRTQYETRYTPRGYAMTTASILSGPSSQHLISGVDSGSWFPYRSCTEIQNVELYPASAFRKPVPADLHFDGSHFPGTNCHQSSGGQRELCVCVCVCVCV